VQECFVIMAFGRPDTERVWKDVYESAIKECGLRPVRVDEEDDGTVLPMQIAQWINTAALLIGDLTHERPNCYLEVGWAMGLDKHSAIILTCREDHNLHSPNHKAGGPKVHFDLQSHGILWWQDDALTAFRAELVEKMNRRLSKLAPPTVVGTTKPSKATAALDRILSDAEKRLKR